MHPGYYFKVLGDINDSCKFCEYYKLLLGYNDSVALSFFAVFYKCDTNTASLMSIHFFSKCRRPTFVSPNDANDKPLNNTYQSKLIPIK